MKLNEGEVICDHCDSMEKKWLCPKCGGKGKVDWVTNAMWRERFLTAKFSSTSSRSHPGLYYNKEQEEEIVRSMAREMAKQIDKEILESISNPDSLKNYARRLNFDY